MGTALNVPLEEAAALDAYAGLLREIQTDGEGFVILRDRDGKSLLKPLDVPPLVLPNVA